MKDNELDRIAKAGHLPSTTREAHERAVRLMTPFLDEFQQAADEQTAADFNPNAETATCSLVFANGRTITFDINNVEPAGRGKVTLTIAGQIRVHE